MDKHSVTVENLLVSECPEAVQSFFADSPDSEYRFEGYLYYKLDMNVLRCEDNYEGNQIFSLLAQQTHKRLVPDGLTGAVFHQRHMLVRRRMVYDLWMIVLEDLIDTSAVSD